MGIRATIYTRFRSGRGRRLSDIRTSILLVMAGAPPGTEPLALAYRGVADGLWSLEDVEEVRACAAIELRTAIGKAKRSLIRPKTPYRTRSRRSGERGRGTFGGAVRRHSIAAALDMKLCDGAVRLLELLLNRGSRRPIEICTNWLATDLRRTTRTIQNYYRQLQSAGFLDHVSVNRRTGRTTIVLSARCEPPVWRWKACLKNGPKPAAGSADPGAKLVSHTIDMKSDSLSWTASIKNRHGGNSDTTPERPPQKVTALSIPASLGSTISHLDKVQDCSPIGLITSLRPPVSSPTTSALSGALLRADKAPASLARLSGCLPHRSPPWRPSGMVARRREPSPCLEIEAGIPNFSWVMPGEEAGSPNHPRDGPS